MKETYGTPEDIFDPEFLKSIGFKVEKDDGQYGVATSIKFAGKVQLGWNRAGVNLTYSGEPMEPNCALGIKEDWNTRTTFNGVVRTREQLKLLIELSR